MRHRAARMLGAALAAAALLAGCAATPPARLYVLDFPAAPELAGIAQGVAVGIGPIEFPQYLDRPQIVTRVGRSGLTASEGHQWAEPLREGITRVLVVDLARRLDSNRVYAVPRRIRTRLDWRVELDIGRLDGALDQEAVLAARWSLFRGEEKEPALTRVTMRREPVAGASYDALVAAQIDLLTALAGEIAQAIKAHR